MPVLLVWAAEFPSRERVSAGRFVSREVEDGRETGEIKGSTDTSSSVKRSELRRLEGAAAVEDDGVQGGRRVDGDEILKMKAKKNPQFRFQQFLINSSKQIKLI